MNLIQLPPEILSKVLSYCSVEDLSSVSEVCVLLKECTDYIWKIRWDQLSKSSGLTFPAIADSSPTATWKSACVRLDSILRSSLSGDKSATNYVFPQCQHCQRKTCSAQCMDTKERKVVLDIGSKTTWLLTTNSLLLRHPTVVAVPRTKQHPEAGAASTSSLPKYLNADDLGKPVCILCNPEKAQLQKVVREFVDWRTAHKVGLLASGQEMTNQRLLNSFPPPLAQNHVTTTLANQHWQSSLWSDIMGYLFGDLNEWIMQSPMECFSGHSDLSILEFFIDHVLQQYKMKTEVVKPSVTLALCLPVSCTRETTIQLVQLFFNRFKAARVCLTSKAQAVTKVLGLNTCIVVDSGANNTVVTIIINRRTYLTRHIPAGGVAIAHYLAQAIENNGQLSKVALSSLDTSRVKSCCRLSFNLLMEEKRLAPPLKQNVYVRTHSPSGTCTKLQSVVLGHELYLAPEMMYTMLDLPNVIREMVMPMKTQANGEDTIKELLRHVVLTGGNTDLKGFSARFLRDLRETIPTYSYLITAVHPDDICRTWAAALGANTLDLPINLLYPDKEEQSGDDECGKVMNQDEGATGGVDEGARLVQDPVWITREQYVVYGAENLL